MKIIKEDICPNCNSSDTQKDKCWDQRSCNNCGLDYEYEHMIGAMGEDVAVLKRLNVTPVSNEHPITHPEHFLRALEELEDVVRKLTEHNKRMHRALALIATGNPAPGRIARDAMRDMWGGGSVNNND